MNDTAWKTYKVDMFAVIAGAQTPIASASIDWELNAIPRAVLTLPVGREVKSLQPALAHTLVRHLRVQQPVAVYARFYSPKGAQFGNVPDLELPNTWFLIFEGVATGAGYTRASGQAQFQIYAQHWLVKMNDSSSFSASSHPSNPSRYSYGAIVAGVGGGGDAGAGQADYTDLTLASEFFTPGNIKEDFWGKALYPFFESWTKRDAIYIEEKGVDQEGSNAGAAEALKRLAPDYYKQHTSYYQPLAVELEVDEDLAEYMMMDGSLMMADPEQFASFTLWDTLVGQFGQEYLFSVVPRINDAIVAPVIPGIRKEHRTLQADTYAHVETQAELRRPLRAVGVLSQVTLRGGSDIYPDDSPPYGEMGVGGWYQGNPQGLVMLKPGPRWLSHMVGIAGHADTSAGADLTSIGNAITPGEGSADSGRETAPQRATTLVKPFLDRYAQALYVIENLKGRQGTVSGAVRFDVAPGSCVKVEGTPDLFHRQQDALAEPMWAQVLRVSFFADAENSRAGTAFHLAHIRNQKENESDNTSVERHPLFTNPFYGASLIPEKP